MRYLINFSYDGSKFHGFQRQEGLKTVQGKIEKALTDLDKNKVSIHASGRTDKGVHAKNQYAHFDLEKNVKLYNLKKYLNSSFDGEIYIKSVENVSSDFHARYNVKSKTYSYYINMSEFNPMEKDYVYQLCKKLNISLMEKASKCLLGEHDFRSFATDSNDKDNTIREINSINFEDENNILKVTFNGNGFLRKMIRNIMGILIEIGLEKEKESYLENILNSKKRKGNLKCAHPEGLYLEEVKFD